MKKGGQGRYRFRNTATSRARKQHLTTAKLTHLVAKDINRHKIETISHVWKVGDKMQKLASKHYGNSALWWVIAHFNRKPTDAHVELGATVYIPIPLGTVIRLLKV
jgi:nucleoid-associated protein YgaU